MLKRIFSIFAIALIITGLFFEGYSLKCPVYADDTTDGWMNVTTNEQLVEAFKYYCKSRDITIEGSVADGVTSFTTKTFNSIANTLGIDLTALQAELKYQTDGNLGTRFLFSALGIDAYNRIFAQFLQDNELQVGQEDVNKQVYSGIYYTDGNGIKVLCYVGTGNVTNMTISAYGEKYRYDGLYFKNLRDRGTTNTTITNVYGTTNFYPNIILQSNGYQLGLTNNGYVYKNNVNGELCIIYRNGYNQFWLGAYCDGVLCALKILDSSTLNYSPININIVSNQINNNTYEGDTIINNEGDTINNYPDNPDNPDLPPSNPTVPDSGGWQDFQMPTMPNDWLIYGMEKKFPFDIPFNIMFALSLLNHEPEIPKFEGDIDLKVCTWHYDIDLTPFDDIAKILRKFEVLAFIIGLAILTKELIMWG